MEIYGMKTLSRRCPGHHGRHGGGGPFGGLWEQGSEGNSSAICVSGRCQGTTLGLCQHVSVSRVPKPASTRGCASYKIKMIEDKGRLVHLAQDEQHLVIDELLELLQVTVHLLLQLIADLRAGQREQR